MVGPPEATTMKQGGGPGWSERVGGATAGGTPPGGCLAGAGDAVLRALAPAVLGAATDHLPLHRGAEHGEHDDRLRARIRALGK